MLEVKSPWNSEVLDKIPQDNENHLSKLLETKNTLKHSNMLKAIKLRIDLNNEIPEDLIAANS